MKLRSTTATSENKQRKTNKVCQKKTKRTTQKRRGRGTRYNGWKEEDQLEKKRLGII